MTFSMEYEQEDDGRWLAEVLELPGALACGRTVQEAVSQVQALGLRIVADKIEHREVPPDMVDIKFAAA